MEVVSLVAPASDSIAGFYVQSSNVTETASPILNFAVHSSWQTRKAYLWSFYIDITSKIITKSGSQRDGGAMKKQKNERKKEKKTYKKPLLSKHTKLTDITAYNTLNSD